jgi:parallel beta-helix repeat protein
LFAVLLAPAILAGPSQANGKTGRVIELSAGDDFQFRLQAALIAAPSGSVVLLPEGRFLLNDELTISRPFLTVRGRGAGKTILDFKGQADGAQGIFSTGNGTTIEDLSVLNTAGDGIKVTGADGVVLRNLKVGWEGTPRTENGGYAVYPVNTTNVLIEGCEVFGASDSGIYVGQSKDVVVRFNRAERNVAGIEIENTQNADVYENVATHNSAGILVFDLPNLNLRKGGRTSVFHNESVDNNQPNFAPRGNIVGAIPKGLGVMILATSAVEVFENKIQDNGFAGVVVANYNVTEIPILDPKYDPTPKGVYIHDNLIERRPGFSLEFGNTFSLISGWLFSLRRPDILVDGILDGTYSGSLPADADRICLVRNLTSSGAEASFGNMHLDSGRLLKGPATRDASAHRCGLHALPRVSLHAPVFDAGKRYEPKPGDLALCESRARAGAVNREAFGSDCARLSAFALFRDRKNPLKDPNGGGIPYGLNTTLFTDYAEKSRFVFLPPGTPARYAGEGLLDFPVGTVIAKTFWYYRDKKADSKDVVETRLLIRRRSGWAALPYLWNKDKTEAELVVGGATAEIPYSWIDKPAANGRPEFTYHVPNANKCQGCHNSEQAIIPIGPKARNLNGDFAYPDGVRNQLLEWKKRGLLAGLPASGVDGLARLARWDDPATGDLSHRARAYLDVNCAHCHNPKGNAGMSGLFLEAERDLADSHAGVCKPPVAAGTAAAKLRFDIVPGSGDASILVHRLESDLPAVKMAPLGRSLVHQEAVELIRAWIQGLAGDCARART